MRGRQVTIVKVDLGARGYEVLVEDGLLDRAGELLAPFARDGRLVVVSDETVWAAQGGRLTRGLAPVEAAPLLVPPGEASKSWPELADLVDRLSAAGVERGDHVVAFGGGMIGDLAGFAAAIFKRGCGLVQAPTSLLAQVDASVGGKTGINIAAGKNLVGAFHQPALVLVDPLCLDTLPPRHLRAGYAEIVKYALIADTVFFGWLETHGAAVIAGEPEPRRRAIAVAVAGKARIVEADERETKGQRALLNFGHTFGHALEAATGFSDRLLHGEAVALGIALAFRFAAEHGLCAAAEADRVASHLRAVGLPVSFADAGIDAGGAEIAAHMRHDKKVASGKVRFVLPRGIGQVVLEHGLALDDVTHFLDRERAAQASGVVASER
jgi:3-dehydroquinate synthase